MADFKPDVTYLAGDFAETTSLSHWLLSKKRRLDGSVHKLEVEALETELDYLQKHSGKVVWIEGNHEHWVEQYLDDHPEMTGLIEYPVLLKLKKRKIEWVPLNELYKVGHLYITHGMYTTEAHAKSHLVRLGCNIVYGHTHRSQTYTLNMAMQRTIKAWGLGCLCNKKPSFMKNKIASWDHGFAILFVASNGEFNLYPVDIINNRFYFNGKSYT